MALIFSLSTVAQAGYLDTVPAAGANGAGQAAGNSIGPQLIGQGTSEMPQCQQQQCSCCADALMKILMGLMALAQAAANKSAKEQDNAQRALTVPGSNDTAAPPVREPVDAKMAALAAKTAKELKEKYGVTYDANKYKMTMADGTTMSGSDLSSASKMAAAGVGGESYKKIMDSVKAMTGTAPAGLKVPDGGDAGGGGGSRYGGYKPPAEPQPEETAATKRAPAQVVAGAVAQYKGDPIGTYSDDLFKLLSRRYKQKFEANNFLGAEAAPEAAPVRTLPPSAEETKSR